MRNLLLGAASTAAALLVFQPAMAQTTPRCNLGNGVKHVVYLQFDNVHLRRDNPNVPSDLEQIPSLLNFLQSNGALLANHHTPLISHTAVDIVTSLTGVYGEKFGFSVGNSFGFFDTTLTPRFQSSFAYWTDLVNEGTATTPVYVPEMVDSAGEGASGAVGSVHARGLRRRRVFDRQHRIREHHQRRRQRVRTELTGAQREF